jgi:membrane-associated phospholipid phosphatase
MKRRTIVVAALIAGVAELGHAQSVARMIGGDVSNAARDFAAIWTSPLHGSRRDYLILGGVLAGSAVISLADDAVDRWAVENNDRGLLDAIGPFRRGGALYSVNELTPYVAGLYVVGLVTKKQGIRDGIFGCVAAYGANTLIRHGVIYPLIGRNRPETNRNLSDSGVTPTPPASQGDQYVFDIPASGWEQHSFPGGHVATVTTCATFLSHRFELSVVEPALAGIVAIMGIGRLADRGHWMSDQVVGVVFGYAIGREIARRQLQRRARAEAARGGDAGAHLDASPPRSWEPFASAGARDAGVRLGWQYHF